MSLPARARSILLPLVTLGEVLAHGYEVHVWCPRCHTVLRATVPAEKLRTKFAGSRFRCGRGAPDVRPFVRARTRPKDRATESPICIGRIACCPGRCRTFGSISRHGRG
jgi:hypothetical protein